MRGIIMNLFLFFILNNNAMDEYSIGQIRDLPDNFKLVPCDKNQVKKRSFVILKCSEKRYKWGYIETIYNDLYYIKDTKNSGREYKLSDLYKLEPKLISEK